MSTIKSWERPWSMDEMIENSNNWSLAGDVALLNSLQNFADKLLEKADKTNDNIVNLINNLEETNLELNIAQNRFQSLRNTQFIESRVYEDDDDETVPEQIDENTKKTEDRDEDHSEDISMAISRGLDILERYFDKIQVTVSDSEDDDDGDNIEAVSDKDKDQNDLQSFILKPKDLYINRPLPYVIGTEEWHKKWHVGLEDSSDDDDDESDTEKISDDYSETGSESTDLQLTFDRSQIKSSDTSSELDNNNKQQLQQQQQQLIKEDQQSTTTTITTSSSDEIIKPITTKNFAQQLAEKLDRVVVVSDVGSTVTTIESKPDIVSEQDVNTRPIQKQPTKTTSYSDVFFDEPPPLDDVPPVNKHGLFSGGGGLFDDNDDDDDDLWSSKSNRMPRQQIIDGDDNQTNEQSGLFDNSDDDDDDIFKTKQPSKVLPTVLQSKKTQLPIFNNEPPPVEDRKKPIGGVSIFGGSDLFNKTLLKRRQNSDEDADGDDVIENEDRVEEPPQNINDKNDDDDDDDDKIVETTKKISLFDDDDDDDNDLFKDDLFAGNLTSKKFTSTLFNDDDDKNDDVLFTEQITKEQTIEQDNPTSANMIKSNDDSLKLFDDTTSPAVNDDIFNDSPKITDNITSKSSTLKLFDSDADDNNDDDDLFNLNIDKRETNVGKQLLKSHINIVDSTPSSSTLKLFDSDDDNNNDDHLFNLNINKRETNDGKQTKKPDINFFDSTPPLLNDNDNNDDDDDFYPNTKFSSKHLFDDDDDDVDVKPELPQISVIGDKLPKLNDNDDDDQKRKEKQSPPGKLKHNLNINVAALMPGALPPSKHHEIQKINENPIVKNEEINDIDTGFDTTDRIEVLQSVTKDRARLPLNRRPSTRRGRKAALETSSKDFKLHVNDDDDDDKIDIRNDGNDVIKEEIDKKLDLFVGIKSDDNLDDLFTSAEAIKTDNTVKVEKFDDLFGEIKKNEIKKDDSVKTKGLFDDDNDEDLDLFTTKKPSVPKKTTKSLFDDDDDDDLNDDIFKTTTNRSKKPEIKVASERKWGKTSGGIKKLDHSQPDDDPLGILNSNEN